MKPVTRPCTLKARVKPQVLKAVKRLSELTGETMSTTVNDLLEAALPGLEETIHYIEEAQRMDAKSKESLVQAFTKRADALEESVNETIQGAREDIRQRKLPL